MPLNKETKPINLRGLFNAETILTEEQLWYYLVYCWRDKEVGVIPFPRALVLK